MSRRKSTEFTLEQAADTDKKEDSLHVITENSAGEDGFIKESIPLTSEGEDFEAQLSYSAEDCDHFDVYQDDMRERSSIGNYFRLISGYTGGLESTSKEANQLEEKKVTKQQPAKLGTVMGVYFPCVQNLFGAILFLRLTWIVGVAGVLQSFVIVFLCCLSTFLTSISLSAIATNGVVPAGGSYFMISRNLGPEFGGAVGILFYLGNTISGAQYIIGAVEIFLKYMVPGATIVNDNVSNYRIYGLLLLVILGICVMIGIRFVSKFATVSLFCVLFSILCIYMGIIASFVRPGPMVCRLGERLLASNSIKVNGTLQCHKNVTGPIYRMYCLRNTSDVAESCRYFENNEAVLYDGIPGIMSGQMRTNGIKERFSSKVGVIYDTHPPVKADEDRGELPVMVDIVTNFFILIGIYFPSVTGIMAGSNRSGDLATPQASIPKGTLSATLTTSTIYLSMVLFFGTCIDGRVMRDKYGESIGGSLVVANLAWPHPWVVLIGCLLSTLGAGLQSLTGAPRLLQAISKDGIIPILGIFKYTTKRGEPLYAQLLTFVICSGFICIGSIDDITPLITMFFLMCYTFVNLATAVNSILKEPSWRPSYKYYHWSLSCTGVVLCLLLMFFSAWYFAFIAMFIAFVCYVYIAYKGAAQEWGDATHGVSMSIAKKALLRLDVKQPHIKNWRPQVLVLLDMNDDLELKHPRLLDLSMQLKAGKGLTIASTVLNGELEMRFEDMEKAREVLRNVIVQKKVKGISKVISSTDVVQGLDMLVQSAGLGGLEHNTVMVCYPNKHGSEWDLQQIYKFMRILRTTRTCQKSILVPKGIDNFAVDRRKGQGHGFLDVWWIVQDGGLLFLLAFLLSKNRIYSKCQIRIFTVAHQDDNNVALEASLRTYITQLRLNAQVKVVDMKPDDITAFTIDRTINMKSRIEAMQQLGIAPNRAPEQVQTDGAPASNNHDLAVTYSYRADSSGHLMLPNSESTATTGGSNIQVERVNQFTFTPAMAAAAKQAVGRSTSHRTKVEVPEVRRMHSAIKLNQVIIENSREAQMIILNMPAPSLTSDNKRDCHYIEYLETLTEGLEHVLFVRGSGRDVVTIYS